MAKPPKAKNNDNKTAPEKATKVLSPKRQIEADHLAGKHKPENGVQPGCDVCLRRLKRMERREQATKRYLLANQK